MTPRPTRLCLSDDEGWTVTDMSDPHTPPDENGIDAEHSDVIEEEQREKHDEDKQANHLLHDEDLPDPAIEP